MAKGIINSTTIPASPTRLRMVQVPPTLQINELTFDNPNPDEPEPKKASLQIFLLNIQEIHWLGPNSDKPEPNKVLVYKFLAQCTRILWVSLTPCRLFRR